MVKLIFNSRLKLSMTYFKMPMYQEEQVFKGLNTLTPTRMDSYNASSLRLLGFGLKIIECDASYDT